MQKDLFRQENYIKKAISLVTVKQDAEDAIQNAFYKYLEGKDTTFKDDNPDIIIGFLVVAECKKINEKRNENKTLELDTFNTSQKMAIDRVYFGFNDGSVNFDIKVLSKNKRALKQYFKVGD